MKNRNIEHKDNWKTPKYLYNKLNTLFDFQFDPCPINHDLSAWNGIHIDWKTRNFINPPYSTPSKDNFVKKGVEESCKNKLCVFLIPVSTSTKLFHEVIKPNYTSMCFIEGRVSFKGINTYGVMVGEGSAPMHDSMIVVFDGRTDVLKITSEQLDAYINNDPTPSLTSILKPR
jgi:hypothetical protein